MNNIKLNELKEKIFSFPFENYPQNSRIHKIKNFSSQNENIYIKRDDELGFGASGSKLRKYLTLIPFLINKNYQEVIIMGGAYSNNVLTAAQLLTENGISPILFLPANKKNKITGNFLLTSIIIHSSSIHWINETDFKNITHVIQQYTELKKRQGIKVGLIYEGANMKESLPGALTLVLDIIKNEQENNIQFNHIFMDSGTGFTASALILGLSYLNKKTHLHILQVAGNKNEFLLQLNSQKKDFENLFKINLLPQLNYDLYIPKTAKSFGSTNSTIFKAITHFAHSTGIITDPIYSAKLFLEGQKIIHEKNIDGNILFIHSGGALSLFGFEEKLKKSFDFIC